MADIPAIQFAPARGGRLAYQVFGDGDATIVAIPPLAQNIELAWEWPAIRIMLERLSSFSRYVHFDKRGTGSSDRRAQVNGIDERVDDLRAVMDAAGVDRGHLFVTSEGGPMAILFAATYPDRVESLTLTETGPSLVPADFTEDDRAGLRDRQKWFAELWGTPDSPVVDLFAPSLASDPEFRTWHQRYERHAASTDSLRELLELQSEMDVRQVLPVLDVPTLVLHRTGDPVVPVELGRELAEKIPGAQLVELDGVDHFNYAGDQSWIDVVERFVTGQVKPRPPRPDPPSVSIVTLGRFAVEVDGVEVPTSEWGSRLSRQLCKRLVAARGWPVTRDELFDLLWPDEFDRPKLGARLSVQLSAVRRVLGGGVVADRQSVRLDLDEVATDLDSFHAAPDEAAVVAAYTGEFLPEDRYEDWTAGTRDEVRSRFVVAARNLAGRAFERGEWQRCAELGRRLIEVDPYDENAYRLLVDALTAAGEPGEARQAHAAWSTAMAELGVEVDTLDP